MNSVLCMFVHVPGSGLISFY